MIETPRCPHRRRAVRLAPAKWLVASIAQRNLEQRLLDLGADSPNQVLGPTSGPRNKEEPCSRRQDLGRRSIPPLCWDGDRIESRVEGRSWVAN